MAYTTINKSSLFQNTKLYAGNATNNATVTGVGFQSDFTWLKARSGSQSTQPNWVFDSIRGATKPLVTNSSAAEETEAGSLKSWQSNGFTLGTNNEINGSSTEYASWNWKAGTSVSGNTTGSGTYKSYSGSVNTTSGFSIIKYAGNGASGHTIPHRLSAIPKMIIVKRLNGSEDWGVYHKSLGASKYINLNTTNPVVSDTSRWNGVEPTSSVFSIKTHASVNANNSTYVAYCFAEKQGYSKVGSYTGNGNASGAFVYTGFKPAWTIIKRTDSADNWVIDDVKRSPANTMKNTLYANLNNAEYTSNAYGIDFLSNGFKIRNTDGNYNSSGGNYIYYAVGQSIVGTNNVPNNAR